MGKELVKISFIIPTFRPTLNGIINYVEKILIKTKLDAEIIIINDLHTRVLRICDFPNKFKKLNINIINNLKNKGPGYSRNIGISSAKNSYLCFLDDDDDLSIDGLEKLKLLCSDADLICLKFFDSKGTFSNHHIVKSFTNEVNCTGDFYVKTINELGFFASHCQPYLFQKEFLNNNNLSYLNTYIVEDISFVTACLTQCKKIAIYDFDFYIYASRSGTLKEDANFLRLIDIFSAQNWLKSYLSNTFEVSKKELLKKTIALLDLFFICRIIYSETNLSRGDSGSYFDEASDRILYSTLKNEETNQYLEKIYSNNHSKLISNQSAQTIRNELGYYFSGIRNKIREKIISKTNPSEITLLYCYGPISIGYFLMLKKINPMSKIFFIDDNINNEQRKNILYGQYTMHIDEFISSYALDLENFNLKITICHLHSHIIKKIHDKSIQHFKEIDSINFSFEINDLYTIFN